MCNEPSATSDPAGSHTRWQRFCPDCRLGTRPGQLPGFCGFHEDSCFQNNVQLLQHTWSAPVYLVIRHSSGPTIASNVIGAVATRLRKRNPRWSTWSLVEQTPVSPKCCCTTYLRGKQVRSCNAASTQSTLVAGARAYQF